MIVFNLVYNLSLLFSFSLISGFIDSRYNKKTIAGQLLQGFLFGAVVVVGMLYPFVLDEGVFFDGRTIVISVSTLFFGPITGLITSIAGLIYRIYQGGPGALTGSLIIVSSFVVGLIFNLMLARGKIRLRKTTFYLLGFITSLIMLMLVDMLPTRYSAKALQAISVTVILIYPVITLLLCKILYDQQESKNYLERIDEEKKLYHTTLYSIGDAVISTDRFGNVVTVNPAAEKLTGWSEKEAEGKPLGKVFHIIDEKTRQRIERPFEKFIGDGIEAGFANHTLLVSRKGGETHISSSIAPIRDKSGYLKGAVLVFRDQSEEMKKLKALAESEERFRAMIEGAPEPVFIQTERKFAYLNPPAVKLFGASGSAELIGKQVMEHIHPDFQDAVLKRVRAINEERKPVITLMELKILQLDGSEIWVEIAGEPIIYNGKNGAVIFVRDISPRKKLEEKLVVSDRIFKHALDMLCIGGFDGYFKVLNPAWSKTLGWSIEELLARPWVDFLHPDDVERTNDIKNAIVNGEEIYCFENRYRCKDGLYCTPKM